MTSKQKKITNNQLNQQLPFVSLCTPTFNRRPFIPFLIKCIELQTYPKENIEWIIIDDGADPIEDLVVGLPYVKYYKYATRMLLGKKRNIMHDKCSGEIIIYMDDDDYYPPERVSHAVDRLMNNPDALCAGSSEMHIYFNDLNKMYQCGPYGPNHSTAATFAFRKELLQTVRYNDDEAIAEEKHFLKNYTIPFVQLDVTKTILVFPHIHNSVDKKTLINGEGNGNNNGNNNNNKYVKMSSKTLDDFFRGRGGNNKDDEATIHELRNFYTKDLNNILMNYPLGNPSHKPETMQQIKKLNDERKKILEPLQELHDKMTNEMIELKNSHAAVITNKDYLIGALFKQNKELKEKINILQNIIQTQTKEERFI